VTQLFLDMGNTRLKYVKQQPDGNKAGSCDYKDLLSQDALFGGVDAIWFSVVGDLDARADLMAFIYSQAPVVHRVSSDELVGFFRPAYLMPETMGVDRWLALFAVAEGDSDRPIIVVDAGTAMTIDVMRGNQHLGGYILPGYRTQLTSLVGQAALPEIGDGQLPAITLGTSTQEAISYGVWLGLASAVTSVCEAHEGAKLYLTGGDGKALHTIVGTEAIVRDNLVIEGLMKLRTESVN
jgi:type III pantothenate kinase